LYTGLVLSSRRAAALLYASLAANVLLFFHKPLFSAEYLFPWDFRGVQLPLISFLVDRLRAGHFALWNPYSYCGYPVFANIEACYFQPFVLAAAWIAAHTNPEWLPQLLEWVVALHVICAGICAYHLFRHLGAAPIAAWAGALIFETGGYFASRAEHIGAIMAVAWMPLAWLAVFKLGRGWHARWFATLALALGLAVLGGFPQPTFAVFLSSTALALALPALRMARWNLPAFTAAASVLGIALSAVIFIPTVQLAQHSVAMYRSGWLGTGGGILPQSFVSFLLPNHYRIFEGNFTGPGDRTFLYLYCSLAGVALALYALAFARRGASALLAIMAVFGAVFSLGENTPLWRVLYPLLPERIRIGIHPEYCYCILTLAVSGLAALGLERLRLRDSIKIALGLVIAADLFFTGSGRPMNVVAVRSEPAVTRDAFGGSREALAAMRRLSFSANPPWRVDNMEGATPDWAVYAPLTRVPSANGVSPLALENIIQLRLFLHDGQPWGWYYPVDHLDSLVLSLLNVRYLTASGAGAARAAGDARFTLAATLPGERIFENKSVLPRFFLVHEAQTASTLAQARALIATGFDFSNAAITGAPVRLISSANSAETVRTIVYGPDCLVLDATAASDALLIAAENDYPGWNAWVDGHPIAIMPADVAFRAVPVPAGTHRIVMKFQPVILFWSLGVSAIVAGILLVLFTRTAN
jgi:hypothetical protein